MHRSLQRTPERGRLLGLALLSARERFDRFVEAVADVTAQQGKIGAAGGENALAVGVVGDGIQEMFEREIRVAARHRLSKRDMKHDLDGSRKHQASSMVARNGYPASAASEATLSTFVSATSHV